jgi:hypothetical protein
MTDVPNDSPVPRRTWRKKQPTAAQMRERIALTDEKNARLQSEIEWLRAPWWRRLFRRHPEQPFGQNRPCVGGSMWGDPPAAPTQYDGRNGNGYQPLPPQGWRAVYADGRQPTGLMLGAWPGNENDPDWVIEVVHLDIEGKWTRVAPGGPHHVAPPTHWQQLPSGPAALALVLEANGP